MTARDPQNCYVVEGGGLRGGRGQPHAGGPSQGGGPMGVRGGSLEGAGTVSGVGDTPSPCAPPAWKTPAGGRNIATLPRCTAHSSRTGQPCRAPAMSRWGVTVCRKHGGGRAKQAAMARAHGQAGDALMEAAMGWVDSLIGRP